ncbi:glycosyltransferase family 4 protein [Ectothiorhodospiraceae bacterium 2226]|nr:glycosyltransferase family 4 protein [Ectothiorhodospiraceae bacterium 2226]
MEIGSDDKRHGLRLLIISADKYPPFRVDVSVLFGRELASRGHTIDWILQSGAPCERAQRTQWGGGTAWVAPANSGTSRFARLMKHCQGILHDMRTLWRVRSQHYDIIQVKDKFISALPAWWAARRRGSRFVYWLAYPYPEASIHAVRDGTARYPLLYLLRGWIQKVLLYRIILPVADHVFVQSEQMKVDVCQNGIDPKKVSPVPMGISLEMFPDQPAGATASAEPRIVYLGTLVRVRRLEFLLRVLERVARSVPEVKLYFIGEGDAPEDRHALEEEAKRMGLEDRVVFTGRLPQDEALRLTATAKVCVSPFYPTPILNSTSPTKLMEYMALGRPVVANDHPEQRLVIQQSGGGLCVRYDEDEFAQAIEYLLDHPQEAEEMGAKGQQFVRRHRTYAHIADFVEEKYLLCVGSSNSRGKTAKKGPGTTAAPERVPLE